MHQRVLFFSRHTLQLHARTNAALSAFSFQPPVSVFANHAASPHNSRAPHYSQLVFSVQFPSSRVTALISNYVCVCGVWEQLVLPVTPLSWKCAQWWWWLWPSFLLLKIMEKEVGRAQNCNYARLLLRKMSLNRIFLTCADGSKMREGGKKEKKPWTRCYAVFQL